MSGKKPFINVTETAHNFTMEDCEFHGDKPLIKTAASDTHLKGIKHFADVSSKIKRHPRMSIFTILAALAAVATIYQVVFQTPDYVEKINNYAPQSMKDSNGGVQVQGNGNVIVTTPNREPITQYNILSASEKLNDGLFHTKIEVLVSFDKRGGLHISQKIYCEEYKDRERRIFQFEGGAYSGLVFNLDCKSSESIQGGNNEYFKYTNDLSSNSVI